MSLAINSLILFFLLVFPGIVFRRFYYTSEFSKQFVLRDPFRAFVSNIVPGICIQLFCLVFFYTTIKNFDVDGLIELFFHYDFDKHFEDKSKVPALKDSMKAYINYESLIDFIKYLFLLITTAIVSSRLIRFLIRKFKLDIVIKLLRFQNEWHYLFKGEIKDFKSFKGKVANDADTTYADVLMTTDDDNSNDNYGISSYYTGLLTDYSLCPRTLKLEHIYLTNAKRYDKDDKKFKIIPGDVFIVPYSKVDLLNLRYQEVVRVVDFKKRNALYFSLFIIASIFVWTFNSFLFKDFFSELRYLLIEKIFSQLILISIYTMYYTVYVFNLKPENDKIEIKSYKQLFYVLLVLVVLIVIFDLITYMVSK